LGTFWKTGDAGMTEPILELKNVSKYYPGVKALDQVKFLLYPGEVHALVGENGAGKSTLIKTITGAIDVTLGEIFFADEIIEKNNPVKALELGIGSIYQEFNLIPKMTVAENIYMGRFPQKKGMVDYKTMYQMAGSLLNELGVSINPYAKVENLTVGYQQLVEIAKSVSKNLKVLIMDEPSAPLTNNEMTYLFKIVRKLKRDGVAIIYISHRLEEIFEICDTVTVFRDGKYIDTLPVCETNKDDLIMMMVNRKLENSYPAKDYKKGKNVLEVKNLNTTFLKDISFQAYEGEILGFAGLVGAGRTEVMRAIFGADKRKSGDVILDGVSVEIKSPADAIRCGIGLIPEDRKQQGALLHMSVKENITYAYLRSLFKSGIIHKNIEKEAAGEYQEKLQIKAASLNQLVKTLSGGNQQKVVLAKWLLMNCKILIFDEPTRGIDVGAKQEIYALMNELVKNGIVIIMISSEMPELLGIAQRIIVMHEGEISGELESNAATQEAVLKLASGIKEDMHGYRSEKQ